MNQKGLRVEFSVPRPRKRQEDTPAPKDPVPRIARLLALAHKWEQAVRLGEVTDFAEIAQSFGLTRARVSQVCALTLLAPGVQERLLTTRLDQVLSERRLRFAASRFLWDRHVD